MIVELTVALVLAADGLVDVTVVVVEVEVVISWALC